jgi:hypothetical protein
MQQTLGRDTAQLQLEPAGIEGMLAIEDGEPLTMFIGWLVLPPGKDDAAALIDVTRPLPAPNHG